MYDAAKRMWSPFSDWKEHRMGVHRDRSSSERAASLHPAASPLSRVEAANPYAHRTPVVSLEAQCAFCGITRPGAELEPLFYEDNDYALYCAHPCFAKARRIRDVARMNQDAVDSARRLGIEPGDIAHAAFPTHCGSCGAALFTGNTSGKCWRCNGGDE